MRLSACPRIQVLPGSGGPKSEFVGLESAPVAIEASGLKIILRVGHIGSLRKNSPVTYRGVEVGVVQEIRLSADASAADLHVLISQRYAGLVRENSVFWNVSGASFSAGLLKGVEFNMESLRTLAVGGIAFATPNGTNTRHVKDRTVFPVYMVPRSCDLRKSISAPHFRQTSQSAASSMRISRRMIWNPDFSVMRV